MTYSGRAAAFAALHQPGNPVVLYNIGDAGSALPVNTMMRGITQETARQAGGTRPLAARPRTPG